MKQMIMRKILCVCEMYGFCFAPSCFVYKNWVIAQYFINVLCISHLGIRNYISINTRFSQPIIKIVHYINKDFLISDLQFPIDLSNVAKDHPFLENDPLQSLYRRLVALNRCATMRLDSGHKQHGVVSIYWTN